MWKLKDFWKIFYFLKNDEPSDLNDVTKAIAKSTLSQTNNLFNNTLDQLCFSNDDYIRLRKFIIDWYSSFKTLSNIQKNITDIYGLPDEHLDELFKSKGFEFSHLLGNSNTVVNYNKGNFYYDLVNLYMKKGSPKTLLNVLKYFGIQNIELLEYMTYRRRSTQRIEFHSILSSYIGKKYLSITDILSYEDATGWDAHYLTSEEAIIKTQNSTKLHLPTKSPYFSLRQYIDINDYTKLIQYLSKKIQDDYNAWKSNPYIEFDKNVFITSVATNASVLETYLSAIFIYYKIYDDNINLTDDINILLGDHGKYFTCYDSTSSQYLDIVNDFNLYLNNIPSTRNDIKNNQNFFYDTFNKLRLDNFLINKKSAEDTLKNLNNDLYNNLNKVFLIRDHEELLGSILADLMKWFSSFISSGIPYINFLLYGTKEFSNQLGDIINFFKPYRSRLLGYDIVFVNKDRNQESIILDDDAIDIVEEDIIDWDTCDSTSCENFQYSRTTYDCGSYYDIGASCDKDDSKIEIEDEIHDILNCKNGYLPAENYVESTTNSLPNNIVAAQSGGFISFDSGGCFDLQHSNDVCMIEII